MYFSCICFAYVCFPCVYALYIHVSCFWYPYNSHIQRGCFPACLSTLLLCAPPEAMLSQRERLTLKVTEKLLADLSAHWFSAIFYHGAPKGCSTALRNSTQCGTEWQWWGQALPYSVYPGKYIRIGKRRGAERREEGHGKGEYKHKQLENKFTKSFCPTSLGTGRSPRLHPLYWESQYNLRMSLLE